MRLTLLLCLLHGALSAQAPDTTRTARTIPVTDSVLRLPVDRASDLLPWVAGGGLDPDGAPSWHGFRAQSLDRVTDGIRWASALRSTGLGGLAATPIILEPDLNALDRAAVGSVAGGPVSLLFTTRGGGDKWLADGSAESEDPLRADGGSGFSRFEGTVGGPFLGGFRFRAAGTLLGRRSAPTGIDYAGSPFYVPTGIDTTMAYPDPSSLPDSIYAPIQRFGPTTSVPYSPLSTADWAVRIDGRLGRASVWAHWLGTRAAERTFNYLDVANPLQARGADRSGSDLAAGVFLPLAAGLHLDGSLSLQHQRSEEGPLTSQGEFDSRDPSLGLMLGGVDLRWDMDNFPVDDQLIANYRNNTPGSRRSPYDLENTAQYALVDQYRNNAYGLYGWSEGGGPVGSLAFDHDSRLLATAAVTEDLGGGHTFRLGAEVVHHDMQHYMHRLTSQASSDVWLAQPVESALLADWTWSANGWTLNAGARIGRFRTGASRPFLLDTVSSSPTVGQYQYYPRISSYGQGDPTLKHFVPDAAHTAFAPHVALMGALNDGFSVRLSVARTARMPDLGYLLAGVNTDLAITSFNAIFGSDLGQEIIDVYEIGVSKDFGTVHLDATLFNDEFRKIVAPTLAGLYDAARGTNNDVIVTRLYSGGAYRGVSVSADWKASSWLHAHGAYTFADTAAADSYFSPLGPVGNFRRHTLALSTLLTAPESSSLHGMGALVSYRVMSGSARPVDPGFLPLPVIYGEAVTERLPSWSSLDIRVARSFTLAAQHLTVYLDARNLLNAENLVRAFTNGDPTHFAANEGLAWGNDSAGYADEARRNGLYSPSGDIDLTFGGAGRGGCGAWVTVTGLLSPPNCAYLIGAEERFGNGDGTYSLTEQHSASMAYYHTAFGKNAFTGSGRSVRIGAQIAF